MFFILWEVFVYRDSFRFRRFVVTLLLVFLFVKAMTVAFADNPPENKIILSAPLTFLDWTLHHGTTDEEGIRYVLQQCKDAGITTIYWRVFDAGFANFKSQFADPYSWSELDKRNHIWGPKTPEDLAVTKKYIANFEEVRESYIEKFKLQEMEIDSLLVACKIAKELGMSINVWYTLNEDDHGFGMTSRFALEHPQYVWVRRDGRKFHSQMSYAYPEVREYKLNLLKELLEYDVDGIFFDWIRTGDVRDDPQYDENGTADFGYEEINITGFKEKYGVDPREIPNNDERWVKYRTLGSTIFMRQAAQLIRENKPDLKISIMVQNPWSYRGFGDKIDGALNGLCLDVETWAGEKLIDSAVPAGYYRDGGNAKLAYSHLKDLTHGQVDIWLYRWMPRSLDDFNDCIDEANSLGAKQILFWEADYIDRWWGPKEEGGLGIKEEMNQVMGGYAKP